MTIKELFEVNGLDANGVELNTKSSDVLSKFGLTPEKAYNYHGNGNGVEIDSTDYGFEEAHVIGFGNSGGYKSGGYRIFKESEKKT